MKKLLRKRDFFYKENDFLAIFRCKVAAKKTSEVFCALLEFGTGTFASETYPPPLMQHSLALLLFLALSLVAALALPQEVINGHYPGRSGDVLLRHKVQTYYISFIPSLPIIIIFMMKTRANQPLHN